MDDQGAASENHHIFSDSPLLPVISLFISREVDTSEGEAKVGGGQRITKGQNQDSSQIKSASRPKNLHFWSTTFSVLSELQG